ncbi:glycine cleavage system protein R [Aliagarivorans taiwanensis]|uniref:glycine cleavage system protein R n=1 Tax=Aliagarivorans taiwanensis TaxID=561966 RepID=UPI000479E648|nr:ACT domain-containing protein [Aliagarivorans taiwanensis]
MKHLVLTVIGKDRCGIVEQVASLVSQHQGNWLASSLQRLSGQFAGMVEVAVPAAKVDALSEQLSQLADLYVQVVEASEEIIADEGKPCILNITANDRAGIVQEVTQALLSMGISINKIQSGVAPAPNWGGQLFQATLTLPELDESGIDQLTERLEALADDLMVDVTSSQPAFTN